MSIDPSSPDLLSPRAVAAALKAFDTPTIANAVEAFAVNLRNEGFIRDSVHCMAPQLPPSVGYAFTLQVRAASPPPLVGKDAYIDRTDWWDELVDVPQPRILVIEDLDRVPGTGAFIGGLHVEILRALGCVAVVTNGAVRDLPQASLLGFQYFAGHVSVSHSYNHVVTSGHPVKIDGLEVRPGDLLHGDIHGVLRVPAAIASRIPEVAAQMLRDEREITEFCRSGGFTLEGLRQILKKPALMI